MTAANVVPTKNKIMTNHTAQLLFINTPQAVTKLKMPMIAKYGTKPAKGTKARKIIPTTA
jgi:hypothetical protein